MKHNWVVIFEGKMYTRYSIHYNYLMWKNIWYKYQNSII